MPVRTIGIAAGAAALAACKAPARPTSPPPAVPLTPLDGGARIEDAVHLLSRLAFGPRPGQAARLAKEGLRPWLARQLRPAQIDDAAGTAALAPFAAAFAAPDDLRAEEMTKPKGRRELVVEVQMTALARHVASERQLFEVIVDFWTNHFSVSLQKGRVRYLAADFVERAVRPHALGRFADLLLATARHPAMLIYLDNAQSVAPRPGSRQALRGRGLNENYARELLELHTVGVAAGYTQDDVISVARVLSGWSVADDEFVFRSRVHDDSTKVVMGKTFSADGEQEGRALLAWLASHPATIRHVCRRLVSRLVADDPPGDVVAAAEAAWRASDGEIASVVRAIVEAPGFWSPAVRGGKLKSPLELVASALRAVDAKITGVGPARVLNRLGQALFAAPAPTGYGDASGAWLSTAGALERMDFALALAAQRIPGVEVPLERVVPRDADVTDALAAIVPLSDQTRQVVARAASAPRE